MPPTDEADDEKPSDLSFKNFASESGGGRFHHHHHHHHHHQRTEVSADPSVADAYKFKSNITQRFSLQDPTPADQQESSGSGKTLAKGDQTTAPPPDVEVSEASHHGIKLENDGRRSSSAIAARIRRLSSSSNGGGNETAAGGLLPVIRERLPLLPPLPGFHTTERDTMSVTAGVMSISGKPPLPPMDMLMPTLAPILPPSPARSPSARTTPPVPIFALNAKGSYYVPMSVDLSVIAPFMALYTEETYSVLHPVTISVNFQVTVF